MCAACAAVEYASAESRVADNTGEWHVIEAYCCINIGVVVARVFPGLWKQSIVPIDVVWVKSELALFYILLDWSPFFVLTQAGPCPPTKAFTAEHSA